MQTAAPLVTAPLFGGMVLFSALPRARARSLGRP